MSVTIRPYHLPDKPGLADAIDTVCRTSRWMATRRFKPTAAWLHALEMPICPHHLLLVAINSQEQIVGWSRLFPENDGSRFRVELGIGLLDIYCNHGIGTQLVHTALAWASSNRLDEVILATAAGNARAIHVFEKCGFRTSRAVDQEWLEMVCCPYQAILASYSRLQSTEALSDYAT